MIIETKEKTDKWVVFIFALVMSGVIAIVYWGIIAVATANSREERRLNLSEVCMEAYPSSTNTVGVITRLDTVICLSMGEDDISIIGLLEKE